MSSEQTDRNKIIVQLIDKGKSFNEVALMFGKGKSTISNIYWRAKKMGKYSVRSYPQVKLASRA